MKTFILSTALVALTLSLSAQTEVHTSSSKKDKKVIIIKKSIDKDGNEVIEKKVLEGDAIKKEDESDDKDGRTIRITTDSMGHEKKIIIDNDVKIIDDNEKGVDIFSGSGSGYSDHTVVIRKNPDGSVEIKDKSGEDFGRHMKVDSTEAKKPSMGVILNDELQVTKLVKDGAAEKGGLQLDDQLTHLDGTFINDYMHLKTLLEKKNIGDKITLTYLRDRKEMKSVITLKGGSTRVYFNR